MRHLDFTIDFETCGLTANAAPIQVAVVPWRRDAERDPFVLDDTGQATDEESDRWPEPYVGYVDLRTCVVGGFEFDPATIRWWAERSEAAQRAVCEGLAENVEDVTIGILEYIRRTVKDFHLDSIHLWAQGSDVDISILRNLCKKCGVKLEDTVPHTSFRDCRTIILEAALALVSSGKADTQGGETPETSALEPVTILSDQSKAYNLFDPLPDEYARGREAHDALYDALRSSWNTWQALKLLKK